ncbi:hypothetical protein JDV02_002446 [Purpureocillium takamizusanense]|uniref:Secreted protein n=1 Tax=Purpureocillium takamizusanense TaxID=2060973 RepID=A0A9Q8V7F9_9HYPO|nr:uncharacterized protein JDV02_002446 [Purpureocillium takamizusanense]UNI15965.1 hypothetical protein JDV02_002446 [Purpureocillium takamizusanense]
MQLHMLYVAVAIFLCRPVVVASFKPTSDNSPEEAAIGARGMCLSRVTRCQYHVRCPKRVANVPTLFEACMADAWCDGDQYRSSRDGILEPRCSPCDCVTVTKLLK